jgi:autotransporter-associated beta strand protein
LLAGNDLRSMTPATLAILTQPELIALNQDPLAWQARRLRDDGDTELWAKPLGAVDGGDVAVTLLNRGKQSASMSFNLAEVGINASAAYALRDLWQRKTLAGSAKDATRSFTVPSHGVVVLRIKGQDLGNSLYARPRPLRWDNGANTGQWNTTDPNWTGATWSRGNPESAIFAKPGGGAIRLTENIHVQNITFDSPGHTLTGGSLTISGSGETIITAHQDAAISSTLVGGLLRKDGAATLTLGGANRHNGGTVIENGTLEIHSIADGTGNLGASWLSMDRDSTLRYMGRGSESTHREIWIDNLSGTRSFDVVHAGASLTLTGGKGEITRPIRKTGAGALTIDKAISGDASVTVDGGRLTLSAANRYTGDTTVRQGRLVLTKPNPADSSHVSVSAQAKIALDFTGDDQVAKITLGDTTHTAPGRYDARTFPAFFSGTGSLVIPGNTEPQPGR